MRQTPRLWAGLGLAVVLVARAWGGERHGGDFLRVELGAAPVGRGGSGLLGADVGTCAWWNPAQLVSAGQSLFSFQHQEAFAGELSLDWLSWSGAWQGLPLSAFLLRQAVPEIPLSQLLEGGPSLEEGGRPVVRREDAADWVLGLATARAVRPGVDAGLTLKVIHRDLAVLSASGMGLDAGVRWQARPHLQVGVALRDLSGSVLFWDDGRTDWIPPEWALGVAYDRALPRLRSAIKVEMDARGELEGAVPDRRGNWHWAWLQGGVEWLLQERLALRAGYAEGDPSAGAGLHMGPWGVDYAWRPHQELGASHLVTLSARLP